MTTGFDSIIVGAGLAGLTAAAKLARGGRDVLVLERHSEIGGRARTDDLGGWLFNQGGHAFYNNGVGHRTLRSLGVEPSGEIPPLAGSHAICAGELTLLPVDAKGVLRTKTLGAVGKAQFGKLMATLGKVDAASVATVTVDEWLSQYRSDVQAVVKAMIRLSTYSAASEIMSADAAISQLIGAADGVLYLHGGWSQLCQQIAAVATSKQAKIVNGTTAASISRSGGEFRVATNAGEFVSKSVIVAAGGPRFIAGLFGLDDDVFGPVGPASKAAVLDLALDRMPVHRFLLGVDEPTYFSVHSPPARLAPEGRVAAVAMAYLHPDDDGSADTLRASLNSVATLAGATEPTLSRFMRSMTVTHAIPLASAGGLAGRPGVEVPGLPGAFVAGDWVGHRGLLADASIASGFDAATLA